ncbi:hypothetical protein F2P81_001915 [Scophthalmus maximus]|uniref:Tyrosine-protein phosphatase non-receptor type 3 n=1 Tax=Scophthalmus maximus TaxID=52904 RepID=A0A6A4TCQ2_SCOMX|nr:hypothetical protein F2P81_001915 [Scophthalmus maximus]
MNRPAAQLLSSCHTVTDPLLRQGPLKVTGGLREDCISPKQDEGVVLLDQVCDHLGLQERQLFSLQIRESSTAIASITANTHSPDVNNAPLMVGLASSGVAIFCNMICSSFFPCRSARSLKHNNNTVQSYTKLITQHLGLSNSKTESGPVCQRVVGGMVWNPVLQRSISSECLETKSLPSRSPPSTPNWRSPRVRHGIRKHRPSSVELTNELKDMSEGEDVFYTYRVSVGSSKDSEGETSPHHFSATFSRGPDDALFQVDDSIGEEESHNDKGALGDGDLMLICIAPDHEGKFGFNVKGGVDQKMPLAISNVKPDSPAGRCEPKLLEGDLVVLINGRDISEHTHDQVVMFIRASRESHSRQLALLIRRKGPGRVAPLLQLPPALTFTGQSQGDKVQSPGQSERVTTLEESMRQLERGIQSGTLCFHFENLYRRKPGLSLNCARLPENMDQNRYKDVLPYDACRVVLQGQEDYINASHITVAPPVSGVCLRYVAAQGPLPQTCTHFWQTVWEQQTHTIIMLTTLTERGRTKCHQYWPHPPEVKDYGHMRVKCHSEECNLAYVMRQFTLTHTQRSEERAVTHLQYVAWPDHGVPDDPSDFLLFISSVRERRRGEEPLMVHCSAGIGRTGVLITMETALTLLDDSRPVFPLEIVRTLRDQRAMMVQTTCQFQFVCEAILRVYKEKQGGSAAP